MKLSAIQVLEPNVECQLERSRILATDQLNSTASNAAFAYSLPDSKLLGQPALPEVHPLNGTPTGAVPEWITFTPDSKAVNVSNSAAGSASVIDGATRTLIAVIPVGEVPKRRNTPLLH